LTPLSRPGWNGSESSPTIAGMGNPDAVNKGKQRSAADAAGRPTYATGAWTSWP
jgi:hypothetical protein